MRLIAAALFAALLLPPVAAAVLGVRAACCCPGGAKTSCPMKRSAATRCAEQMTCGMQSSEASATALPPIGIHRPVLLAALVAESVPSTPVQFDAPPSDFATRARQAPEAPPPKQV